MRPVWEDKCTGVDRDVMGISGFRVFMVVK